MAIVQRYPLQAILETVEGVSPLISREIAAYASPDDGLACEITDTAFERLTKKLSEIKSVLESGEGTPTMLIRENVKPYDFTFMDVVQYGFTVTAKEFDSFSQLLDDFYYEKDRFERTRQRSLSLLKLLQNASA